MSDFLLFHPESQYDEGSLEEHLEYLRTYHGSPSCYDHKPTLEEAIDAAELETIIVDEDTYEVVLTVQPEEPVPSETVPFKPETPRLTDLKTGDRLPNGGILIDYKLTDPETHVILAKYGSDWVTWKAYYNKPDSTSHGNYYRSLAEAVSNYEDRI